MKIPVFVGNSLLDFVKSAELVGYRERSDGEALPLYGAEVKSPGPCLRKECAGEGKLRRNGSYTRQVIEGMRMILVLIYRFRCGLCGKTVSRPYSFLAPYRRFTGKLICQGIELYGGKEKEETSYRDVCADLSIFVDEAEEDLQKAAKPKETKVAAVSQSKDGFCPERNTVFAWVDFVCKRAGRTVQQFEKEFVLRDFNVKGLPAESQCENKNAYKAGLQARCVHQKYKREELNKLTYGLALGRMLTGRSQHAMEYLRAYFLKSAETCADLLSDVVQMLPIAHT